MRALAAIFVVFIHFPLPGKIGTALTVAADFAVPFFFLCSGYFCFGTYRSERVWKKTRRIAWMASASFLLYGLYRVLNDGWRAVARLFTIVNIGKWVLFNVPIVGYYHLWFLYALIDCYLLWMLINRLHLVRFIPWLIVGILTIRLAVYEILPFFTARKILPLLFNRSAWLIGMGFFLLGYELHVWEDKIKALRNGVICIAPLLGLACMAAEYFAAARWGKGGVCFSVGQTILAVSVFAAAVKWPHAPAVLGGLGRKHSMMLYLLHPLVGDLFLRLGMQGTTVRTALLPFAAIASCWLISLLCGSAVAVWRSRRRGTV